MKGRWHKMALRKGKTLISIVLKDEVIKNLEEIAKKELTSRSAIAGKIIEEGIRDYGK